MNKNPQNSSVKLPRNKKKSIKKEMRYIYNFIHIERK